jgi:cytosine/adenosine deaminase-related metal-dependent hydrolase
MERILIKDGYVLTMDTQLKDIAQADVLVESGKIAHVGPGLKADDAQVIDAQGKIVMPGFVDCHRHMWQTQLRGITADWSLFDYSVGIRSVYSAFYQPEDAYLGCYAGFLEALNAGTTTIADHCHIMNSPEHSDAAVKAFKDSGMRGIFCYGLFNNPKPDDTAVTFALVEPPQEMLRDVRRVKNVHFSDADDLVTMGVGMIETDWFPMRFTRWQVDLAREINAHKISSHVGMAALSQRTWYIDRLHRAGLLGPDFLFIHGSGLSDSDLKLIANAGASVISTPDTDLQMGMGYPVLPRLMDAKVKGGLGIDIASNNSADMFTQIRLCLQVQRSLENYKLEKSGIAPKIINRKVRDFLEAATIGGARALSLDSKIGSITPGKDADLILIRTDTVNMVPVVDPVASVAFYANVGDVDTVMVRGKILKQDGQLVGVDWPVTARKLKESSDRIVSNGQAKGFEAPKKIMEMIFPLTRTTARQARIVGTLMRVPMLREPLLRIVLQYSLAKMNGA